jgi:transposase
MGNQKFTAEFREEALRRVLDRGYSVKEVSASLGVSTHRLYKWLKDVRPRPEKRRDEGLPESKRTMCISCDLSASYAPPDCRRTG